MSFGQDCIVPGFLDEFPDWAERHAPLDLTHPHDPPLPECPRCEAEAPEPQLRLAI